jgi:hypothetical protein
MPVNGLMLTLAADECSRSRVLDALQKRSEVELGDLQDRWLQVVTDAADERGSRDVHAWLESLPGVETVDVILVGLDHETSSIS